MSASQREVSTAEKQQSGLLKCEFMERLNIWPFEKLKNYELKLNPQGLFSTFYKLKD